MNITEAQHCQSIDEVRAQIDKIDREIIELFAKRNEFVHAIVQFKTDEESVVAIDRKNEVINQRAKWAETKGLSKTLFRNFFEELINNNIQKELTLLERK